MNISYKWLKEYVDFDLTPQQVCDALTSTGLEVDALEEVQSIKADCLWCSQCGCRTESHRGRPGLRAV